MSKFTNYYDEDDFEEHYRKKSERVDREHAEREKERERMFNSFRKGQVLERFGSWNVISAGHTEPDTFTVFLIIWSLDETHIHGAIIARASTGKKFLYPDVKVGRDEEIELNFANLGGSIFRPKDMKETKDYTRVIKTVFA
jgi:hypothetical protein